MSQERVILKHFDFTKDTKLTTYMKKILFLYNQCTLKDFLTKVFGDLCLLKTQKMSHKFVKNVYLFINAKIMYAAPVLNYRTHGIVIALTIINHGGTTYET